MKNVLLKGLSAAGLCLLAMASESQSLADGTGLTCPQSGCPTCPQSCPSSPGYCRTGSRSDCCLNAISKWALYSEYYICPPDYGWNAPVKVPVIRRGVTYYRYYPEHWYGSSTPAAGEYRSYPQVYAPNDTTQLGYTYQQVPYWQPAPYRLPPPPVPSEYHVREPHHGYHGRWQSSYTPIHHHQTGNVMYWVEPLGQQARMSMPPAVPVRPAGPVGCPPAPEPTQAPKKLIPESAVPAPVEPATPAPSADEKSVGLTKSRLTTMLTRFRRSGE
jgi:hypothetical protein